jgi:hypothetical protein
MPWCDTCDAYRAPTALNEEGSCAVCSEPVDRSDARTSTQAKAPWHFWLMVAALVLYLGWRLIEGVIWAADGF